MPLLPNTRSSGLDHPAPSPAATPPPPPSGSYEEQLVRIWLALFGFCVQANPNASAFDPGVHLAWSDVSIIGDNQVVRVFLKQSKMINGRSAEVFVGGTHDELCWFKTGRSYVAAPPGAVHRLAIQSPKHVLFSRAFSWLARAGVPTHRRYSGQIGAASAATEARIPDSVIQAIGRCSSQVFLRYIRVPPAECSNPLSDAWTVGNTRLEPLSVLSFAN